MSTVFISPPSSPAPTSAPLLTRPVQSVSIFDDDMSFHSYCIVCDKIIVPIKEKEGSPGANGAAKKKKKAQGTIRIRNPDGTTTTRTANGQKVTRPVLKRNQTSQGRLAAVAANNSAAKLQNPLPRTKTSDSLASNKYESRSCPPTPAKEPPFRSSIYCCRECAAADAGRQDAKFDQLARNLSYDFGSPIGSTFGFTPDPIHTHIVTDHVNPGPPSPLCVSGSDTESSDRSNPEAIAASSAPTAPEYFRIPRQTPEEAWMENQRQRRGSMHNSTYRSYAMTRQQSHQSHYTGETSSDSLSSMWQDHDLFLARSISGGGALRNIVSPESDRSHFGAGRRSISVSSDHDQAGPNQSRPLPRSSLSQTSLTASPPAPFVDLPPGLGIDGRHTLHLLGSYANAFPVRHPSGISSSYAHKGFVYPPDNTPVSPTSPRRDSINSGLSRPASGTIRAKKGRDVSWDAFGKQASRVQNARRASAAVPIPIGSPADQSAPVVYDTTPRQSLEVRDGRWQVKYSQTERRDARSSSLSNVSVRSTSSDDSRRSSSRIGFAIPRSIPLTTPTLSNVMGTSCDTPRDRGVGLMLPPARPALPRAVTAMPDIGGLDIGSPAKGVPIPISNKVGGEMNSSGSAPKGSFTWKREVMTYPLPKGLSPKVNTTKAGLFYFK